jgi:hypothetical protein
MTAAGPYFVKGNYTLSASGSAFDQTLGAGGVFSFR